MRILKNQSNQMIFFVNASFYSSNDILIISHYNRIRRQIQYQLKFKISHFEVDLTYFILLYLS